MERYDWPLGREDATLQTIRRKKYDVGTCIYLIDAYFKKEIEEFNAKEIKELNAKINAQRRAAGTVGPVRQSGSDTDIPPVGSHGASFNSSTSCDGSSPSSVSGSLASHCTDARWAAASGYENTETFFLSNTNINKDDVNTPRDFVSKIPDIQNDDPLCFVGKIIVGEISRTYPNTDHSTMTIVMTIVIGLWLVWG
ncbi:hypothetical protein PANT_22c00246 [Moesziomyces antarcticus T-34]|uniref:Uncharacterized protein n=1 Tax=Pseudozyma antarctica (strain T-34) TaxID=1151754 RepID=M9MIC0_PSEA3|nr:hypothetical protein PANT_22c00246 [Moesziomyces antarcticus T-34]